MIFIYDCIYTGSQGRLTYPNSAVHNLLPAAALDGDRQTRLERTPTRMMSMRKRRVRVLSAANGRVEVARTTLGRVDLFDTSGRGHGDDGGHCTYKAVSFDLKLVTVTRLVYLPVNLTPSPQSHHTSR